MTSIGNGRKCQATTASGNSCKAWAQADSEYCFIHDPSRAKDRAKARKRGGHARKDRTADPAHRQVEITEVGDVLGLLETGVNDLLKLENSISRARAVGSLAGILLKALEVGELEERLAALEERLAKYEDQKHEH